MPRRRRDASLGNGPQLPTLNSQPQTAAGNASQSCDSTSIFVTYPLSTAHHTLTEKRLIAQTAGRTLLRFPILQFNFHICYVSAARS